MSDQLETKKEAWHVIVVREFHTTFPKELPLRETFATKAEAEVVAQEMRAEGPYHRRCWRKTYHVLQSPQEVEFGTCKDSGRRIMVIKRDDVFEASRRWFEAWEAKQAKRRRRLAWG